MMSIDAWDELQSMDQTPNTPDNRIDRVSDEAITDYGRSKWLRYKADEYIKEAKFYSKSIEVFYSDLQKLNDNDAKSLLYARNILDESSLENISLDSGDYRNLLIEYLKSVDDPLSKYRELILYKIDNMLPEKYLDWFKNDLRCSLFLAYLVKDSIFISAYKGKDELISVVTDYLRYEIQLFIEVYPQNFPDYEVDYKGVGEHKTIDILYVKSTYLKNRSKSKDLKWIDPSNQYQIDWAYNYLSEEKRSYIILEDIFFPQTNEEKYELIVASLDILSNVEGSDTKSLSILKKRKEDTKIISRDKSERIDVIERMRKAWVQLGCDTKNSKDKFVLNITDKNKKKLFELAKNVNQTPNKFINQTIEGLHRENFKIDS